MEVPQSTQRHTRQTEADTVALSTLCDGSFVFCDVTAEISAQVMVQRRITRFICRIGPVIGIGLPVGSILVVSPTYEPPHYKTNKMTCVPSEDSGQPGHPPSQIRVFAARTMGSWGPNVFFMRTAKILIRLGVYLNRCDDSLSNSEDTSLNKGLD